VGISQLDTPFNPSPSNKRDESDYVGEREMLEMHTTPPQRSFYTEPSMARRFVREKNNLFRLKVIVLSLG
jgi:hypothetical protein